jgi:putative colanic acid biosynthesis acetyltransferase WcaF
MDNNIFNPPQRSSFSLNEKIKLRVWMFVNSTIFYYTPYFSHKVRIFLLRLFGANIAWNCSINRKAIIDQPWNLEMGQLSSIDAGVWILCREKVIIGSKTCIGREVGITSGSHNINSLNFEAINKPVIIGDNVWVINRSYILPGVQIGNWAVIGACSLVNKNVNEHTVVGGNPVAFIQKRDIKLS